MKLIGLLDSVRRDMRHALRALVRKPTFAGATLLTLALGIGATTAIFSVVYSVIIKPLPYANAEGLVRIRHAALGLNFADMPASPTQYFTYRDENRTFAFLGLWQQGGQTLTDPGEPRRLRTIRVTHGVLQALAVQPLLGRWFTEEEHGPATDSGPSVILSYAFWQQRYGGDEAILGRDISIDSRTSRIVGVMPPNFRFLDMTPQPDLVIALQLDRARQVTGGFAFQALGRLKPGVTPEEARVDLERVQPIWLDSWPLMPNVALARDAIVNWRIAPIVRALKEDLVGDVANTLWVLMGAIFAALLVACANIANLMLVRMDARRDEFAIRAALGARPSQLAREVFAESSIIGIAGAALGLVLAIAGSMALLFGIVGIHGVIAYVVSQRTREIGIRSALGAEPRQLKKMFLLHGLGLSALGGVVGLVAAMALGRWISTLLFGVGPLEPVAYVAAVVTTLGAAALASYLPARRAATIDPIETLRAE